MRYIAAIDGNTEWLAERLPHMHSFIAKWFRQQGEHSKRPERTLKSYVLQETEAISREQKLRWARTTDRAAVNLQHDGVLLQLRPYDDKPYVETALTSLCSATLGYPQPVSHKPSSSYTYHSTRRRCVPCSAALAPDWAPPMVVSSDPA